ncbi:MAG TPA: molybdate ABC transporter substrate-binding protein [Sphingomonas sp.]|nr:molybdate ABC transporter substrate-binding protein [Sphingomonas sp.]
MHNASRIGVLRMRLIAAIAALLALIPSAAPARPPLVLAAASLQESLSTAADAWAGQGHERPVISFAGSSALARQIDAGAPADIFISADEAWMNDVQRRGHVRPGTRADLLGNALVLVEPATSHARAPLRKGAPLARLLGDGRLAMANVAAVPAGKYGKAALQSLGLWKAVALKVAQAENVRAALALVERGVAPFGVVYATDAMASRKVRIAGVFPEASHPPIRYPIALLTSSTSADAAGFERFLRSAQGKAIFRRYGFRPL